MRRLTPALARLASDPARIGAQVRITPRGDGSGKVLTGVVTDKPTTGKMAVLLKDGRAYWAYVRPRTPTTYRLLIENEILVAPIEDVTLIQVLD